MKGWRQFERRTPKRRRHKWQAAWIDYLRFHSFAILRLPLLLRCTHHQCPPPKRPPRAFLHHRTKLFYPRSCAGLPLPHQLASAGQMILNSLFHPLQYLATRALSCLFRCRQTSRSQEATRLPQVRPFHQE